MKFNRRNIFLRDEHRCQYCGRHYTSTRLSSTTSRRAAAAGRTPSGERRLCLLNCNVRKGGRTPAEAGMKLIRPRSNRRAAR
ncbi:MAG: hypothetical protein U0992_03260 [Planctomycetaceae bacterium]